MPKESQWTFETNPDGTVTSTVTGRETIEVNRKIQPWWWFYNSDDPKPPTDYGPDRPNWLSIAMWHMRNPIHNGNFYVWGVADRNFTVTTGFLSQDKKTYWSILNLKAASVPLKLPFFCYEGKRWVFKFG